MVPVYFDPMVLQRYMSNPRDYYFQFNDSTGVLGTSDESFRSTTFPDEDKILLQTFGLGWADGAPQAIGVYLVYLAKLTPRHQSHWVSFELADQPRYELDRDYVRSSAFGAFPEQPSAVEAILREQRALNDIAGALGRPGLFARLFDQGDRPPGLVPFLVPSRDYFDRFIVTLDQLLSDNLSRDFFAGDVGMFDESPLPGGQVERIRKGTIRLLKEWLESRYPEDSDLAASYPALRGSARSSAGARASDPSQRARSCGVERAREAAQRCPSSAPHLAYSFGGRSSRCGCQLPRLARRTRTGVLRTPVTRLARASSAPSQVSAAA